VAVDRLHQILAGGVSGQIQPGIQRIEFEHVVMEGSWAGPGAACRLTISARRPVRADTDRRLSKPRSLARG
jgi:hypothetical protein